MPAEITPSPAVAEGGDRGPAQVKSTAHRAALARLRLTASLEEIFIEFRAHARVEDYLSGFSISEAITDRLLSIGTPDDHPDAQPLKERTEFARLASFEANAFAAIDAALQLDDAGAFEVDDDVAAGESY